MTTALKLAIAAVIIAALGAVVGYDLMYGGKKSADPSDPSSATDSGLSIARDFAAPTGTTNPAGMIESIERREAGAGTTTPNAPVNPAPAPANSNPAPATNIEPAPANEEYVVQPGETLSDIAERKYGDPNKWTVIAKANRNVNPNRMRVGTKLTLPSLAAPVPADAAPVETASIQADPAPSDGSPRTYTIQAGDVLSKIAQKFYGSSSAAALLREANPETLREPDFLTVGAKILLPEAPVRPAVTVTNSDAVPTSSPSRAEASPAPTGRTHTVARGDSLWKIAEKHHGGIGVLAFMDRLVAANPEKLASKNTALKTGWVLAIPDAQ